jgi:hypothetical protein
VQTGLDPKFWYQRKAMVKVKIGDACHLSDLTPPSRSKPGSKIFHLEVRK